jgi:hypothetical protein
MIRLIKKIIKSYLVFGLGVVFGAIIASVISWAIMTIAHGNPDLEKFLDVRECLEEKINE